MNWQVMEGNFGSEEKLFLSHLAPIRCDILSLFARQRGLRTSNFVGVFGYFESRINQISM